MNQKSKLYSLKILVICTLVFTIQQLYQPFTNTFSLNSSLLYQRPWTLLTYMFLHANIEHYASNMFALVLFGLILESVVGSKEFLKIYFLSGLFSGIFGLFFYDSIIGASGAIFGLMASLALLRPNLTVWVGYIPMPMILALLVWSGADFLGIFLPSDVAHIGHLAGMLFGIVYTLFYLREFMEKPKQKKQSIYISEETIREWERRYMR